MTNQRFLPNLALLIGRWVVEMSTHDANGAVSTGGLRATKEWIAEGRYIEEWVEGEFGGALHEKRTLLGFNSTRQRYEYATADNHDAVILLYTSLPGAGDGRSIDLWTDYVSPGDAAPRGVLLRVRTRIEIVDESAHHLHNFYAEPGEPERLFLEYKYRRES